MNGHRPARSGPWLLAVVVAGGTVLAGCSTGTSSADDTGETTELRVLVQISPVLTEEFYEDLVAPFEEANPEIDVVLEGPTGANITETLQQQLAAGTVPDVSNNVPVVLASEMAALPDAEWVTESPFYEVSLRGGEAYAVGTGIQVQSLMFYNKTAYEEAGITELPTTVEELTSAFEDLNAAGYTPLSTAGEWVTASQFQMLANPVAFADNPNWNADRNAGEVSFADSEFNEYLEVYQTWVEGGLVDPNAVGLTYEDATAAFLNGSAATYVMGNWIIPEIDNADLPFEVGVYPAPSLDGSPAPQAGGPSLAWSVLESSDKKEAALKLVEYLASDEEAIMKQLQVENSTRPGFAYETSDLGAQVAQIVDEAPGFVLIGSGRGDNSTPPGFLDQLGLVVQGLYLGETASSGIASLDEWWTANAVD